MLKEKVVLVTGASRGIGRATALLAADYGAKVIVNYNKSEKKADEVVNQIKKKNQEAIKIKANVANEEEVKQMFKEIKEKYGQLDVLVNNAGIMKRSLILMTKNQDLDEIIDINLKGVFYCMQNATKMMIKKKKGKIINVSSIVGKHGDLGLSVYSATKGALIALTKAAAKELGGFGITVNAVAPGIIDTDMTKDLDENKKKELVNSTALKQIGKPEDVAKVIVFLSSDLSDYISGEVVGVDGCELA